MCLEIHSATSHTLACLLTMRERHSRSELCSIEWGFTLYEKKLFVSHKYLNPGLSQSNTLYPGSSTQIAMIIPYCQNSCYRYTSRERYKESWMVQYRGGLHTAQVHGCLMLWHLILYKARLISSSTYDYIITCCLSHLVMFHTEMMQVKKGTADCT